MQQSNLLFETFSYFAPRVDEAALKEECLRLFSSVIDDPKTFYVQSHGSKLAVVLILRKDLTDSEYYALRDVKIIRVKGEAVPVTNGYDYHLHIAQLIGIDQTEEAVRNYFKDFGKVLDIGICDRPTPKGDLKRACYVRFED